MTWPPTRTPETPPAREPNMSLWAIEASVAQLLQIIDDPEAQEEERSVAIAELERYVAAEVKKVDAVRAVIRHCEREEAEALAAKKMALQEAELQSGRAQVFASRRDRIKRMVMAAMEFMGVRKLEGRTGRLRVQANGGKQALTITDRSLIPAEYEDVVVRMPARIWVRHSPPEFSTAAKTVEVATDRIRKTLETPCAVCDGRAVVDAGQDADGQPVVKGCDACAGTGRMLVPGARLEPRGEQLRVE